MNLYFLGTGTSQGIPIIGSDHPVCRSTDSKDKRLRVSVWVSWDNYSYVIDCGPDFRQQMLSSNCQKIDGILFTHEHADHTACLDDILPFNFRQGEIPIFAHQRVIDNLKQRFDYVFETIIHRNSRVAEAPMSHTPVALYDVTSKGAVNFFNLAEEFLRRN